MSIMLLLVLISTISFALAQHQPARVFDMDGNVLRAGTQYYILPIYEGTGVSLTLAMTRNVSCPLDVVLDIDNGLPLTLIPVDPKKEVIWESTDLNIVFSNSTMCNQSNVWMIEEYEGEMIVTGHGISGNPGPETVNNWFKIEKYDNNYKLVFCPAVCYICKPVCKQIGVNIAENGSKRLALSDQPFKVKFVTA
ncbi:proteinase inhibitor I3 [Artemisia annua]|uniref:Proteinase inhibitor I3 n=1 Tax=Artemisia annua TaxID=35608 RepID=A0A2U1LQX4_ARTAN|nr:proteinase inhibitor I3 [Artemisia annua]